MAVVSIAGVAAHQLTLAGATRRAEHRSARLPRRGGEAPRARLGHRCADSRGTVLGTRCTGRVSWLRGDPDDAMHGLDPGVQHVEAWRRLAAARTAPVDHSGGVGRRRRRERRPHAVRSARGGATVRKTTLLERGSAGGAEAMCGTPRRGVAAWVVAGGVLGAKGGDAAGCAVVGGGDDD